MARLDKTTFDEIVALLAPAMGSLHSRQAFVTQSLYDAPLLVQHIDYDGNAQQFTVHLVRECVQFGQIAPGQLAVVALLAHVREQVGYDGQQKIDRIITGITREHTETPFEFIGAAGDGAHIFISYSRMNLPFVQQLTRDLQARGINIWIDKVGLKAGTPDWENALREAIKQSDGVVLVASPESRLSPYVRDELAIAKAAKRTLYPVWAAGDEYSDCIPMGMGYIQSVDMRGDAYERGVDELVAVLAGTKTPDMGESATAPTDEEPSPVPPDFEPRNPYKGLRAFRAEDRSDFFGRDALIAELIEALRFEKGQPRFLAVVGASGSGKSSVVMAGLLPALVDGALNGSQHWRYLNSIVPGTHPLENLTIALAELFPEKSQTAIREDLDNLNTRGLHTLAKQAAKNTRLVLYIDQFEELFTLTASEDERRHFIDLLTTAVTEPDGALLVILSLRADFYDRPLEYNALGKLIEEQQRAVLPLTLADLYDVIEQPARLDDVRVTFEDGLVTDILFAVRDEIGALPLLQFTLDQLFERRDGQTLTHVAYADIGGVRGALTKHAEQTYLDLPSDEHRRMARALFLRLIEPGTTEQDTTRRRADRSEITLPDPQQTRILSETAEIFVNARLLIRAENTIEVAHEALIREWDRLKLWLNEARDDLRLQKKISVDTADWIADGRQSDYGALYSGRILREAQSWGQRSLPSLDEIAFLRAGAERQAQLEALEEHRKRELNKAAQRAEKSREASLKAANQARLILTALIATAIFGVIAFFVANAQYVETLDRANATLTTVANAVAAADAQLSDATATLGYVQDQATVFSVQQARAGTQVAGLGIVPQREVALSPQDIIAEATQIAALAAWQPLQQEFNGIEMVQVPAGCFWMGTILFSDTSVHQQCFDAPFWIGKYEVSYAEYARFIDDGGYDNPDYWTEAGWDWRGENTILQPSAWENSPFNAPQQPVVGVSWYEAMAYARWAEMALCSEHEWEYAARGPNSTLYPWGNEFVADNWVYSGNSGGSPAIVGSRPDGASWVGALDMSGNVWEWTLSVYEEYPYVTDDGREDISSNLWRVLRGGSWFNPYDDARAVYRDSNLPRNRDSRFGFRLCRPPSR